MILPPRRGTPSGPSEIKLLNGVFNALAIAHTVSIVGFPSPASNWESVDFAMPQRCDNPDSVRPLELP